MTHKKQTILFVDDEESLLEVVGSVLETEGFNVVMATSVEQGIEHLNTVTPDIVISDVTLPGKSGFEFLAHIRSLPHLQHVPFLFLSAHTDSESVVAGKEIGSDDYLSKPVDFHLLLSSIRGKLKRKEQLREASVLQTEKIKSEIFRLITHEMKTPLTSILGATEMLSDAHGDLSAKELTEFMQMLQNSSKRLNSMVDDFLTVTKIESGEISREMDIKDYHITPYQIVQRIASDLDYQCRNRNVTIDNKIVDTTIAIHMHAPHLENILRRIVDNAIKFSRPESTVIVNLHQNSGFVFSVRDFGFGIAEGKKSSIFQKFVQIDRDKHEQQGSGLGLYIAHNLARLNKAELWFESEDGKGSSFYLRVPKGG